jgi:hypothetical protein
MKNSELQAIHLPTHSRLHFTNQVQLSCHFSLGCSSFYFFSVWAVPWKLSHLPYRIMIIPYNKTKKKQTKIYTDKQ